MEGCIHCRLKRPTAVGGAWRLARKNVIGSLGGLVVLSLVLLAIFAPFVAPYAPNDHVEKRLLPPSSSHVLGTDEFGRDVLSRIVFGSRVSLYVGVVAVAIALLLGAITGLVSGYAGGLIDNVLMRVVDVVFSFPALVLAIAITGILGPHLNNAVIAIGIVYAPRFARVVRGPTLSVMTQEYVLAARALGAPPGRIVLFHILPNVAAPTIVQTSLSVSTGILTEAALSFLGVGAQPPTPSWGTMLGTGRVYLETAPWLAIFPGIAIMLAVLGFNLFGDGLRDVLDPTLRRA